MMTEMEILIQMSMYEALLGGVVSFVLGILVPLHGFAGANR